MVKLFFFPKKLLLGFNTLYNKLNFNLGGKFDKLKLYPLKHNAMRVW